MGNKTKMLSGRYATIASAIAAMLAILLTAGCGGGITGFAIFESGTTPNIMVKNITHTNSSALIEWNTSVMTNSTFYLDNVTNATINEQIDFNLSLEGLLSNTTYHFNITACDNDSACGNLEGYFGTEANIPTDTEAPVITVTDTLATNDSAYLSWTTDETATSSLDINGVTTNFTESGAFSLNTTNLASNTTYTFNISACDIYGNCGSQAGSITTNATVLEEPPLPDTTAPAITILNVTKTYSTATVSWETSESSRCTFTINGVSQNYTYNTQFSTSLTGLVSNTTYTFNISACDASDNCNSTEGNFTTESNDIRPPRVTITSAASTTTTATISWTTDEPANSSITLNGATNIYGTAQSFSSTFSSLTMETAYPFSITACDIKGNCNMTNGSVTTNTTRDITAPTITLTENVATTNSATVRWTTSESANCTFRIGSAATNYAFSTNFTRSLSGLESNTNYRFNITACDNLSNCNTIAGTFETEEVTDETAPTVEVQEPTVSPTSVTITWSTDEESTCTFIFNSKETTFEPAKTFTTTLSDLVESTAYTYQIIACDNQSNCVTKDGTFTTTAKPVPPPALEVPSPTPPAAEAPATTSIEGPKNDSDMLSGGVAAQQKKKTNPLNIALTILIIGAVSLTLVNVLRARGVISEDFIKQKLSGSGKTNKAAKAATEEKPKATGKPPIEEVEKLLSNADALIESFQFQDSTEIYTKVRQFYSDANTTDVERSRIYDRMMTLYDRLMVYSMVSEIKILADKYSQGSITTAEYYSLNMFMRQVRTKLDRMIRDNPKDKNILLYSLNEYNKAMNQIMWRQ